MGTGRSEACGRCSMTSLVDAAGDGDDGERASRDPFGGDRIEVSEAELRVLAWPAVLLGRVSRRLDEFAAHVVHGR